MKLLLLTFVNIILIGSLNAQIYSNYYEQGFESVLFPPQDWTITSILGADNWERNTIESHSGAASAYMTYDSNEGLDWLISPAFEVTQSTDSVVFWMLLDFQGYAPDSLSIKVSTTDNQTTSFNTTILGLQEGINYPPNTTNWVRYSASLENFVGDIIYIGFKHYNSDGDGLYIDDIEIGTKPDANAMALSIDVSNNISTMTFSPEGTVKNNGLLPQSFDVKLSESTSGYTSTQNVLNLAPGASATVVFDPWSPIAGNANLELVTLLVGDEIPGDDTLTSTVSVLNETENLGWQSELNLTNPRWGTAPVFSNPCISDADTGRIYVISGYDNAFANSPLNTSYNIVTDLWETNAPIPTSRGQVTPIHTQDKIFVIGGYAGSFAPVTTNSIYDIATNTWSTGAPLTTAVGDYGAFLYQDSLIYIIAGYNGSADVNLVQIYNVNTNIWSAGTTKIGSAVGGGRAGLSGNKIVFTGGYNQTNGQLAESYLGEIDPLDPTVITWSSIPDYPGGTVGRHAAGSTINDNGKIYFGGGDPDGGGTSVLNTIYAYNTLTSSWEIGPNMIHGASNISAFAGVVRNDTSYLVTTCGYDGIGVPGYMEWLAIETVSKSVTNDTMVCAGQGIELIATGGESYSWNSNATLSDTTIANPTANPSSTTTYYVTIDSGYGCPKFDSVQVELNDFSATLADDVISTTDCVGELEAVASGGIAPYSYQWSDPSNQTTAIASDLCAGDYSVVVTDAFGCSSTLDASVISTASVESVFDQNMLEIYPNPTSNYVTIEFSDGIKVNKLQLIDALGKTVEIPNKFDSLLKKNKIDLSSLSPGIYYLEVITTGETYRKAIVKK